MVAMIKGTIYSPALLPIASLIISPKYDSELWAVRRIWHSSAHHEDSPLAPLAIFFPTTIRVTVSTLLTFQHSRSTDDPTRYVCTSSRMSRWKLISGSHSETQLDAISAYDLPTTGDVRTHCIVLADHIRAPLYQIF